MLWYSEIEQGIILSIKVSPSAKKTRLLSIDKEAPWIKLAIGAPPEKGKATHMTIEYIAHMLHVPVSACSCISGTTSTKKKVCIHKKISYDEVVHRLSEFLKK